MATFYEIDETSFVEDSNAETISLQSIRTEDTSVTAEIFDRPRRNPEKPPIFGPKIRKFARCMVKSRSDLLTCTFVLVTLSLLMTCAYFIIIESTTMKHQKMQLNHIQEALEFVHNNFQNDKAEEVFRNRTLLEIGNLRENLTTFWNQSVDQDRFQNQLIKAGIDSLKDESDLRIQSQTNEVLKKLANVTETLLKATSNMKSDIVNDTDSNHKSLTDLIESFQTINGRRFQNSSLLMDKLQESIVIQNRKSKEHLEALAKKISESNESNFKLLDESIRNANHYMESKLKNLFETRFRLGLDHSTNMHNATRSKVLAILDEFTNVTEEALQEHDENLEALIESSEIKVENSLNQVKSGLISEMDSVKAKINDINTVLNSNLGTNLDAKIKRSIDAMQIELMEAVFDKFGQLECERLESNPDKSLTFSFSSLGHKVKKIYLVRVPPQCIGKFPLQASVTASSGDPDIFVRKNCSPLNSDTNCESLCSGTSAAGDSCSTIIPTELVTVKILAHSACQGVTITLKGKFESATLLN